MLTGPNGSGKSTLLRCVATALRPQRGTLTYGGDLALTLSGTASAGASYDLFSFSGGSQAGTFTNVVLGGSYTSTMSNAGGVWTGTDGGLNFLFAESTGRFEVSAVPEPATLGLAGVAAAALIAHLARRKFARGE
jgi:energy-coupling factor transporter ATP-binding protein EcfA2